MAEGPFVRHASTSPGASTTGATIGNTNPRQLQPARVGKNGTENALVRRTKGGPIAIPKDFATFDGNGTNAINMPCPNGRGHIASLAMAELWSQGVMPDGAQKLKICPVH